MIAVVDYQKGNLRSVEKGLVAAGAREVRVTSDACEIARASTVVLPGVGAFADAMATMRALGQDEAVRERVRAGVPFLGICLGMQLLFEAGEEGAPEEGGLVQGLGLIPGVVARMPKQDAEGNTYKIPHVGWNSLVPPACQPAEPADAAKGSGAASWRSKGSSRSLVPSACQPTEQLDAASRSGTESRRSKPSSRTECASSGFHGDLRHQNGSRWLTAPTCEALDSGSGFCPGLDAAFACPLFADTRPGEYFYFTHSYAAPITAETAAVTRHSVAFASAVQVGDAAFGVQFHPEKSSDAGHAVLSAFVRFAKEG